MCFRIVEDKEKPKKRTMLAKDMKPGQIARIVSNKVWTNWEGKIVMRSFGTANFEVMDLTEPRPNSCWEKDTALFEVELLEPGTRIVLEITEENK